MRGKSLKYFILFFITFYLLGLSAQLKWMYIKYDYFLFNIASENIEIKLFYYRIFIFPFFSGIIGCLVAYILSRFILKANQSLNFTLIYKKLSVSFSFLLILLIWPLLKYNSSFAILVIIGFSLILLNSFPDISILYFNKLKEIFSVSDINNERLFKISLITGGVILFFICSLLIIPAIFFWLNISINSYYIIISYILTVFLTIYLSKLLFAESYIKKAVLVSILFSIFLATSVYTSSLYYDLSWDGIWYHQDEIYFLAKGWNPIYGDVPDSFMKELNSHYNDHLIVNNYAKGAEICEACIYKFFNKIEYAKCLNILFIISSFFVCLALFLKLNKLTLLSNIVLSGLICVNPVSFMLLTTFLVDGQFFSSIIIFIALIILLAISKDRILIRIFKFFIILVLAFLINVKFTGVVFGSIFIIAFLLYFLINKQYNKLKKLTIFFVISFIFAFVVIGYQPYIKNTIKEHYPFYPLNILKISDNAELPANFQDLNRFERTFLSIFSYSGFIYGNEKTQLKIPLDTADKDAFKNNILIIGGFGTLFSGIIILSIVILIIISFRSNKYKLLLYIIFIILFTIFLDNRICLIARYSPHVFLIPFFILFYGYQVNNISAKFLSFVTTVLLILNLYFIFLPNLENNLSLTKKFKKELSFIQGKNIILSTNQFELVKLHLNDFEIKYKSVREDDLPNPRFHLICDVKYNCNNYFDSSNVEYILKNDFETYNVFDNIHKELNKFYVYNDSCISDKYAYSGKHSLKLNNVCSTGSIIKLKNVKSGDRYFVETKRYKQNNTGSFTVFSKDFWLSEIQYIYSINENWENIMMRIDIPNDFKSDELNIYLGNENSNTDCYFDDMIIYKLRNKEIN